MDAINKKQNKGGSAYASGKILVVFLNAGGDVWFPSRVAKKLPKPFDFENVLVVGLFFVDKGKYVYGLTQLDPKSGNARAWSVCINETFDSWEAKPISNLRDLLSNK